MHRPSVFCRLAPTGTSAWLPSDNTTDADPPRFFNWRSLHQRLTQPLMFYVVARAPLTEPQAPITGCSNFRVTDHLRNRSTPGTAFTLTIRTALAPNGLRTALLTIQNIFRRTWTREGFLRESKLFTRLSTRGEGSFAYPFALLIIRDIASTMPRLWSS